jgi:hypothetical protein
MSYTYLQAQGAESSAASYSDIDPYALSRLTQPVERCCCNGNATESCLGSPSGTMCEPSTVGLGGGGLMPSAAASRAKTSPLLEKERESMASGVGCGEKWQESFAKWNPDSCSWKIRQLWLFEDLDESLETWPRWGLMRRGECWERTPPGIPIIEPEFGWLPTPSGVNGGKNHTMGRVDEWGGSSNPLRGKPIGKALSPNFEEIVMGWPH